MGNQHHIKKYQVVTQDGDLDKKVGHAESHDDEIVVSLNEPLDLSSLRLIPVDSLDSVLETITCTQCGNDGPDSLAEAIQEGWKQLEYDPDGLSWNYLGECFHCWAESEAH